MSLQGPVFVRRGKLFDAQLLVVGINAGCDRKVRLTLDRRGGFSARIRGRRFRISCGASRTSHWAFVRIRGHVWKFGTAAEGM